MTFFKRWDSEFNVVLGSAICKILLTEQKFVNLFPIR